MSAPARHSPRARAFTLMEMILSCAITTIIAAALGSVILLSARVMPRAKGATTSQGLEIEAARAMELLTADLSQAIEFKVLNKVHAVLDVPDRDGDGSNESIVYDWDGTLNAPLTRSINGGTPANVLDQASEFSMTKEIRTRSVTADGVPVTSAEVLLASYTGTAKTFEKVTYTNWPAVSFPVTLPAGATSFTVSKIDLNIQRDTGAGVEHCELRTAWPDGTPTNTTVATALSPGAGGALAAGWQSYTPIYLGSSVLNSRMLSLVLVNDSGLNRLSIATTISPVPGMRSGSSSNLGVEWTMAEGSWNFRVYGQATTVPSVPYSENRVTGIAIDLKPRGSSTMLRFTTRIPAEPLEP